MRRKKVESGLAASSQSCQKSQCGAMPTCVSPPQLATGNHDSLLWGRRRTLSVIPKHAYQRLGISRILMGNGNLTSRNLFSHKEVKQPSFEGVSAITKN